MESKRDLAVANFIEGYNCAQSVLVAFSDEIGMSREQAARLASSFGGGMGQLREVCGTVSAMFMILGIKAGYCDPTDREGKKAQYEQIRALAETFAQKNGSYLCRDLLLNAKANLEAIPHERTREFYQKRPCAKYVADAADLIEALLAENADK